MFGGNPYKKAVKQAVPLLSSIIEKWGVEKKIAQSMAVDFANAAVQETISMSRPGIAENENLAELYLSKSEPQTVFGKVWIQIIPRYEKQRNADKVTPEDIRWYWSKSTLDRSMVLQQSNADRTGFSISYMQSKTWDSIEAGMDAAAEVVHEIVPMYGSIPDSELNTKDPNRPLPLELYRRIEAFRTSDWDKPTMARFETHPSMNSFLREQISLGKI